MATATQQQYTLETLVNIARYIEQSKKLKNSYLWAAPGSASQRRRYEQQYTFEYAADGIELYFSVSCSCKNIYVNKYVKIDGVDKTIRALRSILRTAGHSNGVLV